MDPRHTLYKTLETLAVDPEDTMSAPTDQQAAPSSGVTPEGIEKKLKDGLGAVYVEIADLSGMLLFPHVFILFYLRFQSCLFSFILFLSVVPCGQFHAPRSVYECICTRARD
jgi:hypothetical protein